MTSKQYTKGGHYDIDGLWTVLYSSIAQSPTSLGEYATHLAVQCARC